VTTPWLSGVFRFPENDVYFVAEVGPNHDGSLAKALEIVDRIAASGADAVKFQTYETAANVVARDAPLAAYMKRSGGDDGQLALLDRVRLSFDDFRSISSACSDRGLTFTSTPFDEPSVDFLAALRVPFLKVPSGEITNLFLLRAVAKTGLPLVVSTGMANLEEIGAALEVIEDVWAAARMTPGEMPEIMLLHCTSAYPAPIESANLRAMATLADRFGVLVGYSDHTVGRAAPLAAAALGARLIEKHVTPDPALPGPDHAASFPLAELPQLIAEIKAAARAPGSSDKQPHSSEMDVKRVARRSLAAATDIARGQVITEEMLTALRPEVGISPMAIDLLLGRAARRKYSAGDIIATDEIEE